MGIGDWGLGIGDWGLGIGPNPQSPIPNPQYIHNKNKRYFNIIIFNLNFSFIYNYKKYYKSNKKKLIHIQK